MVLLSQILALSLNWLQLIDSYVFAYICFVCTCLYSLCIVYNYMYCVPYCVWSIHNNNTTISYHTIQLHFIILHNYILSYYTTTFYHAIQLYFITLYNYILSDCTTVFKNLYADRLSNTVITILIYSSISFACWQKELNRC